MFSATSHWVESGHSPCDAPGMSLNRERFENRTKQTMVLWLEPWGGGYQLKPGSKLLLLYDLAKEETTDTLHVDVATRDDELWISVWVHSENYPQVLVDDQPVGCDR
jgi:hypothetical protein